jgi:hypothetical protein
MNLAAGPKENSGWPHPWTFFAFDLSKDALHIRSVTYEVFSESPQLSSEARKVLEAAMAGGKAFNDDGPCYRSKELVH